MRLLFAGLGLLWSLALCAQEPFEAKVKRVVDGDSLVVVKRNGESAELRISAIDAPEHGQPWSKRSRKALTQLLGTGWFRAAPVDTDRYGRVVVDLFRDSRNVGEAMVEQGYAWAYRRYLRDNRLLDLEAAARSARRGIWSDPLAHRVAPWKWRSSLRDTRGGVDAPVIGNKRTLTFHLPEGCPGYGQVAPRHRKRFNSADDATAAGYVRAGNCNPLPPSTREPRVENSGTIVGNRRSRIYHWSGCPGYNRISRKNRVRFADVAAAQAAHYRAARNCR